MNQFYITTLRILKFDPSIVFILNSLNFLQKFILRIVGVMKSSQFTALGFAGKHTYSILTSRIFANIDAWQ